MAATIIRTQVQDVAITGRVIERTGTTLEVELLWPFGRLSDGRSIMTAAMPYISYDGSHGDMKAATILADLYRIAAYVHAHIRELRERWTHIRQQVADRHYFIVRSRAEYVEERRKSRRLLRDGAISPDDHESWMIELRNGFEEWSLIYTNAVDALIADVGIEMSLDVQAQVMRQIDPSFDLRDGAET